MAETKKTVVARLFAEHRGALQAFLFRRVPQRPDAAELAQEVYVRMLRVPDIAAIRDPGAYLYTGPGTSPGITLVASARTERCSTSMIRWCRKSSSSRSAS